MKKKQKNTKFDLIWIIPEIMGSFGILISVVEHIRSTPPIISIGLMTWTFEIALAIVVLKLGFKVMSHSYNELKRIWMIGD